MAAETKEIDVTHTHTFVLSSDEKVSLHPTRTAQLHASIAESAGNYKTGAGHHP